MEYQISIEKTAFFLYIYINQYPILFNKCIRKLSISLTVLTKLNKFISYLISTTKVQYLHAHNTSKRICSWEILVCALQFTCAY